MINIPAKLENINESGKGISGEKPDWLHGVKTFKKGDMVYRRLAVGSGKYTFEFTVGG